MSSLADGCTTLPAAAASTIASTTAAASTAAVVLVHEVAQLSACVAWNECTMHAVVTLQCTSVSSRSVSTISSCVLTVCSRALTTGVGSIPAETVASDQFTAFKRMHMITALLFSTALMLVIVAALISVLYTRHQGKCGIPQQLWQLVFMIMTVSTICVCSSQVLIRYLCVQLFEFYPEMRAYLVHGENASDYFNSAMRRSVSDTVGRQVQSSSYMAIAYAYMVSYNGVRFSTMDNQFKFPLRSELALDCCCC